MTNEPTQPNRSTGVGDPVPDVTLQTLDGQPLHLGDMAGKKYILFMWASW